MWPETVRALIVHSAEWTDAMRRHVRRADGKAELRASTADTAWAYPIWPAPPATRRASDALTLIAQDIIHPFHNGTMREMPGYASHGLQFDVRRAAEYTNKLRKRLNRLVLAAEEHRPASTDDTGRWKLGPHSAAMRSGPSAYATSCRSSPAKSNLLPPRRPPEPQKMTTWSA